MFRKLFTLSMLLLLLTGQFLPLASTAFAQNNNSWQLQQQQLRQQQLQQQRQQQLEAQRRQQEQMRRQQEQARQQQLKQQQETMRKQKDEAQRRQLEQNRKLQADQRNKQLQQQKLTAEQQRRLMRKQHQNSLKNKEAMQKQQAIQKANQRNQQAKKQKKLDAQKQKDIKDRLKKLERTKQLKAQQKKKKQLAEKKKKEQKNNNLLITQTLNQKPSQSSGGGGKKSDSNQKVASESTKLRQIQKNQSSPSVKSLNQNINNKGTKGTIDSKKFDYIFGNVNSNSHNAARSNQLAKTMESLGVYNNSAGKKLLSQHFDSIVKANKNITNTFSNKHGNFEVRESLFFGPSGKSVKFETTFQIMSDGTRRFSTVIPKGSTANL